MKNILRISALIAVVSLAMLSEAHAGSCVVRCNEGTSYGFWAPSGSECCTKIDELCWNGGRATYNGLQCAV